MDILQPQRYVKSIVHLAQLHRLREDLIGNN